MFMNKFKYLFTYQLKKRILSKAFLISNAIIFVVLVLVTNINNIARQFEPSQDGEKILIVDETSLSALEDLNTIYKDNYQNGIITHGGIFFEKADAYDETLNTPTLILRMEGDLLKADLHKFKLSQTNTQVLSLSVSHLARHYFLSDKTEEEIGLIEDFNNVGIHALTIHTLEEDSTVREVLSVFAMFLSIPIFMLIMMAVQFVGGSIVEEKSSKAIEYIIANVSPQQHFFAKIFTSLIALVLQTLLILAYGLVGTLVSVLISNTSNSSGAGDLLTNALGLDITIINSLISYLPLTIIYLILFGGFGGLLLMVIMAFVASVSTTNEEYQQFQSPMMFIVLIGFYGGMFGTMLGSANIFIKVMAYIPLFSPFMVPSLYLAGSFMWWEALISLIILFASVIFTYKLIMPMYKQSILSYDTDKFMKRVKKAFKSKNA